VSTLLVDAIVVIITTQ